MSRFVRSVSIAIAALLLIVASGCATPDPATQADAKQGWTAANRVAWYTASQGSRLIPQVWLDNLEQPDSTGMFLDPAYIRTFRHLPNPAANWESPDKACPFDKLLPLGFAVDWSVRQEFLVHPEAVEDRAVRPGAMGRPELFRVPHR